MQWKRKKKNIDMSQKMSRSYFVKMARHHFVVFSGNNSVVLVLVRLTERQLYALFQMIVFQLMKMTMKRMLYE